MSSFEPPRVPVTGILEYRGGTAPPCQPGIVHSGAGTAPQRVASGGGGGDDDSSSDHSCQTEGGPPSGGRGPP